MRKNGKSSAQSACITAGSGRDRPEAAVPGANRGGVSSSLSYGRITSLALDPIEKKPLAMFEPGKPDIIGWKLWL